MRPIDHIHTVFRGKHRIGIDTARRHRRAGHKTLARLKRPDRDGLLVHVFIALAAHGHDSHQTPYLVNHRTLRINLKAVAGVILLVPIYIVYHLEGQIGMDGGDHWLSRRNIRVPKNRKPCVVAIQHVHPRSWFDF